MTRYKKMLLDVSRSLNMTQKKGCPTAPLQFTRSFDLKYNVSPQQRLQREMIVSLPNAIQEMMVPRVREDDRSRMTQDDTTLRIVFAVRICSHFVELDLVNHHMAFDKALLHIDNALVP